MENLSKFGEFFEMYGWPGILAIAVLGALWFILQKMLKKSTHETAETLSRGLSDIAANLNNQNDYLIQVFTELSIKQQEKIFELFSQSLCQHDKQQKTRHVESVNQRFKVTYSIMDKLNDMLNYHKSDRAVIIEFHNSKENMNGLSFVWYDVQYEAHKRNIIPIGTKCKEIQVSNLYNVITDLFNSDGIITYTADDIKERGIHNVLYNDIEKDAKGIVYAGIYNDKNDLIGLVVLEYIKSELPTTIDEDELTAQISYVSTLLNFEHYDEVVIEH